MWRTAARWPMPGGRTLGRWIINGAGSGIIAASLATGHAGRAPWIWFLLGAGFAGWLVFVVLERRCPRAAFTALAVCSLLAASVTGPAGSTTMAFISLIIFAAYLTPSVRLIVALCATDMGISLLSSLAWQRSATSALLTAGGLGVVTLVGLGRRQQLVQARQTELLLEQTRRTQAEQERAAALDERARIAREMHDVLAHSLGALGMHLEVAEALLDEHDDADSRRRALDHVHRSRRLAVDGLAEARRAVAALRDAPSSMPEALAGLAERFRRDHRMTVELRTGGEPRRLPDAAAVSLVGVAREALTNAARHAPDTPVTVVLDYDAGARIGADTGTGASTGADTVRLCVHNALPDRADAVSVDRDEPVPGGGFGLTGMRERLALAGGTLTAGPGTAASGGRDWWVTAEVPR